MQSNIYITLSAQIAMQHRLDTLANNMANVSTAGFRGEEVKFEQLISQNTNEAVSFVSQGTQHISLSAGELLQTGNQLDVAVRGQSWLAVQTASGVVYTRDGRMQMSPTGELTTLTGNPVLDVSGSPLQLDASAGPPTIGKDGTLSQNGRQLGALGLFRMDPEARLSRGEGASVIADIQPTPELDFNSNGVIQGFIEKSNINPVLEMTRLIEVQRSFEAVSNVIRETETSMQDAMRLLSGP
jgi:flagellar basal-body rod protein FlgF